MGKKEDGTAISSALRTPKEAPVPHLLKISIEDLREQGILLQAQLLGLEINSFLNVLGRAGFTGRMIKQIITSREALTAMYEAAVKVIGDPNQAEKIYISLQGPENQNPDAVWDELSRQNDGGLEE